MSQINTNGINVNYPIPGKNNSSQGFRDNFTQIKTNLNTASAEITDLQNKVVLKAALDNSTLNNDMANTLISNLSTRGFRATTYNLGNALSGTVLVDVNKADVHYGTVTQDVLLQFGSWAPTNTESNVVVRLTIANTDATVSLPSQCVSSNNNFGVTLLENYANVANTATLTAPANTQILEYTFSTIDCGNTITVSPINRPFQSTQIVNRNPPPTGIPGDVTGTVSVGTSQSQLSITNTYANDEILTSSTSSMYIDMPVTFTGELLGGITEDTTYYINNIVNGNTFTISSTAGGGNVNLSADSGNMYLNPVSYMYVCTNNFSANIEEKDVINTYSTGNIIKLSSTVDLTENSPIIFTGNTDSGNTNILENEVYYIKTISSPNITISQSRFNGIAGTEYAVGNKTNVDAVATVYVGPDIWKRIQLNNW
jgi:hypothetical protein